MSEAREILRQLLADHDRVKRESRNGRSVIEIILALAATRPKHAIDLDRSEYREA